MIHQDAINPNNPSAHTEIIGTAKPAANDVPLASHDRFDTKQGATPPLASMETVDGKDIVKSFQLELDERKKARLVADVIVSCVSPMMTSKGATEDEIGLLLLRILGKVYSQRQADDLDSQRAEQLIERLQLQQANESVSKLKVLSGQLTQEQKARSDELTAITQGLSSISDKLHQAIMASLREMRGA